MARGFAFPFRRVRRERQDDGPRPGALKLAVVLLAVAVAVLAVGLELSYRGPAPVSFTVPIHDGEILIQPAVRVDLPPPPGRWPELPARLNETAAAAAPDGGRDRVPPAPELSEAIARSWSVRVASRLPREGRLEPAAVPPPAGDAADTRPLPPLLPDPPELAGALARGPGVWVAKREPRESGARQGHRLPSLPVAGVAAETLPPLAAPLPPPAAAEAPPPPPLALPSIEGLRPPATQLAIAMAPAPAPAPEVPSMAIPAPPLLALPPAKGFVARPGAPLLSIVLWGLGRSTEATENAIAGLPGEVTLGLTPYGQRLQHWADRARASGHEVLLEVPMEPRGYPTINPGPDALLMELALEENLRRLEVLLTRFDGFVGVTNLMGSRFTASEAHMRPVLRALQGRDLIFLDSRAAGDSVGYRVAGELGLPRAENNRYIDNEATAAAIDLRLEQLERAAEARGTAVGLGSTSALTVERLAAWIPTLEKKGLQLAPLSAVAKRGNGG